MELPADERLEEMTPSKLLQLGIDLHNAGRYFEAHEAWEAVWLRSPEPLRRFYQGLIQITAGFVHLTRNEYPGTHRLLGEGLAKLRWYEPDFLGVATGKLVAEAALVREEVLALGEHGLAGFDGSRIPRVEQLSIGEARILGVPGRALHYYEWPGRGGATVILVHAAGQIGQLWRPVAARLAPDWRVLVPDLPGHGASDPRPGGTEPVVRALSAWAAAVAPDTTAVAGLQTSGGLIAAEVARECNARAIVCGTGDGSGHSREDIAGKGWAGAWEMFTELRNNPPHSGWRPDLVWWLVEQGTRTRPDGRIGLASSKETVRGLAASLDGYTFAGVEESPLIDPPIAAKRIREVLDLA
jgi:predicted metal-dependent hydrolase/pimeloyl-ACP methyl ester carboxylesterase